LINGSSFLIIAYNTKYPGNGNEVKEIKPCIKWPHVNCTLKLPNRYMKKIQVYFIHQCQVQYKEYNATEDS